MRFEAYKIVLTREQFIEPQPSRLAHVFVKKGRNFDPMKRCPKHPRPQTFKMHRTHITAGVYIHLKSEDSLWYVDCSDVHQRGVLGILVVSQEREDRNDSIGMY